ncbi:MAG: hypothetical protein ACQEQ0_12400 [Bacteroidota bacterium]
MTTLLTVISDADDFKLLMPPALKLAKAFDYKILVTSFRDKDQSKKKQCPQHENVESIASSEDLPPTILHLTEDQERDIQLVMFSEKAISLTGKRIPVKYLSALRELKVPYLIVSETHDPNWRPENIYFPLCLREGEKEASAWAAHWTKYNNSNLQVLYPVFKNPDQQKRLWMIFLFVERLFNRANILHKTMAKGQRQKEAWNTLPSIMDASRQNLIIFPTTRYYSPEYYFTGPPEFRLLKNRGNTPVLFVNPRKDLYVPCG